MILLCTAKSVTGKFWVYSFTIQCYLGVKQAPECALKALLSTSSPVARAYMTYPLMGVQVLASSIAKRELNSGP